MTKIKAGIVGCGVISDNYLSNLKDSDVIEIIALADLNRTKAQEKAERYGIKKILTTEKLMQDPEIDLVINLTLPGTHARISMQALNAGKHVYSEKPLAMSAEDADAIIKLAEEKNLQVGCAPDNLLAAPLQTCKKIIEDGRIGRPVFAAANPLHSGVEAWQPAPVHFSRMADAVFLALFRFNPAFFATASRSSIPGFLPFPFTVVACSPPIELL